MWTVIKTFFSDNFAKIVEFSAIIAAAAASVAFVYKSGKSAQQEADLENVVKDEEKAHAIEDKNASTLRDGDAAIELHKKWGR